MIPISIKVSLDFMKSLYAKFIDWDHIMIDLETSIPSHATNTAISEDLGQIEYILTDKTGTLTENKMIFRRCCINGIFYGNESGDALKDVKLLNAVSSGSPDAAQSQDEDALDQAAAQPHMIFVNKSGNIFEAKFNTTILQYEVLEILEFTSDRKRMSVVLKDCQDGKILLLSKGADEAILPYARAGQQTRHFIKAVEQYAHLGLRTLCLVWRELKKDEYQDWSSMFKEASSTLVDREWRVAEVCQRIEHDLEILGVTAIEDRLQDEVPETIETLRKAGINFWMLTRDKQNTAITKPQYRFSISSLYLGLGRNSRNKPDDSLREPPNKAQKRVHAINRELPPPNEQFILDFEQLQSQFPDHEQLRFVVEAVLIPLVAQCSVSSAELPVDQISQAVSTITSSSLSQSGMLPPLNTITNSSNFQSSNPASPLNSIHTIGSPA
ncbi:unnamed protein product [Vicia faba]|uniref:Phospholipid-transporting ATPase n=1 Tax=Vicia faba TaxID=3906 RepID=A0AAV0YWB7_VICFA|nr:unnamed protein product [Vicia faba]